MIRLIFNADGDTRAISGNGQYCRFPFFNSFFFFFLLSPVVVQSPNSCCFILSATQKFLKHVLQFFFFLEMERTDVAVDRWKPLDVNKKRLKIDAVNVFVVLLFFLFSFSCIPAGMPRMFFRTLGRNSLLLQPVLYFIQHDLALCNRHYTVFVLFCFLYSLFREIGNAWVLQPTND